MTVSPDKVNDRVRRSGDGDRPGFGRRLVQAGRAAFTQNLPIKFVALVLAVAVFILVNTDEPETRSISMNVEVRGLGERVIVTKVPESINVMLRGSRRQHKRLDRDTIRFDRHYGRIVIDAANMKDQVYEFRRELFRIPPGFELVSISPGFIDLRFEQITSVELPIRIKTVGKPSDHYVVDNTKSLVQPARIRVRGAASRLSDLRDIETEAVSIAGRETALKTVVNLEVPNGVSVEVPSVSVTLAMAKRAAERSWTLPVRVRNPPAGMNCVVEPDEITLTLRGWSQAMDQVPTTGPQVYVELPAGPIPPKGLVLPVRSDIEIPDIGLEMNPRRVRVKRR